MTENGNVIAPASPPLQPFAPRRVRTPPSAPAIREQQWTRMILKRWSLATYGKSLPFCFDLFSQAQQQSFWLFIRFARRSWVELLSYRSSKSCHQAKQDTGEADTGLLKVLLHSKMHLEAWESRDGLTDRQRASIAKLNGTVTAYRKYWSAMELNGYTWMIVI
jgi:hypothetical protein